MRKLVLSLLLLSPISIVLAQTEFGSLGPSHIIGPPPEPSRIALYGQHQVSPYTGKPDISLPIYDIRTPRLSMPVNLAYEGTGVKVDDLASWTGTGWLLNTGGMITRVVMGIPDETYPGGFLNQAITPNLSDPNFYYDVCYTHYRETEPDKYYFNFNGRSGAFSFDTSKNIFQMPVSGLKITMTGGGFEIVDEKGDIYDFTTTEFTTVQTANGGDFLPYSISTWWLTKVTSADQTDSIKLTYEADQQEEEIQSTYSAQYGTNLYMPDNSDIASTGNQVTYTTTVLDKTWNPMRLRSITYSNGRLDFNRVNDRLDGGSSRLDGVDIYNLVNGTYGKQRSVKLITGYFQYTGTRTNTLAYYSGTTGRYRLKLLGLEDHDALGNTIDKYSLGYYDSVGVPFRSSLEQDYWGFYNGATQNDDNHTNLPQQTTDDYLYTIGGANRDPNETYMKAGVLTSITYPTGGYSLFDWEAHKYLYSYTTTVTQGSGCSSVGVNVPYNTNTFTTTVDDPNATLTVDIPAYTWPSPTYSNSDWEDSAEETRPGVFLLNATTGQVLYQVRNMDNTSTLNQTVAISLPAGTYQLITECFINASGAIAAINVNWHTQVPAVTVKTGGGLRIADIRRYNYDSTLAYKESYSYGDGESGYGNLAIPPNYMNTTSYNKEFEYWYWLTASPNYSSGCITGTTEDKLYKSEPVAAMALASGSSVVYPVATKYYGDNQSNAGKTIFHYQDFGELDVVDIHDDYILTRYPWREARLVESQQYRNNGNGTYTLVRDAVNNYTEFAFNISPVVKLGFKDQIVQLNCFQPGINDYYLDGYEIMTGVVQLTSDTVREYDLSGNIYQQTYRNYAYDNQYNSFLVSQSTVDSKGQAVQMTSTYPFQKSQLSGLSTSHSQAIDRLVAKNIIGPVIEKAVLRNSNQTERIRTNYRIWDAAQQIVQPDSVEYQLADNPSEVRMVYDDYDAKGNLLQQSRINDTKLSYIWDYSSSYPIAAVSNATDQQIAFTSFEADGTGNWTIGSASSIVSGGVTGSKAYSLNSDISRTGLSSGTTYIVSYWAQSGSPFTISGTMSGYPIQGKTVIINGTSWTYFEHQVSGQSTITLSGTGVIDELRLYPANAQMTSYTYTPQLGMTSEDDVSGKIIYYEYDSFTRMKDVKDQDGNIIKTYTYHYKGQ
jgi:hypothetical protein